MKSLIFALSLTAAIPAFAGFDKSTSIMDSYMILEKGENQPKLLMFFNVGSGTLSGSKAVSATAECRNGWVFVEFSARYPAFLSDTPRPKPDTFAWSSERPFTAGVPSKSDILEMSQSLPITIHRTINSYNDVVDIASFDIGIQNFATALNTNFTLWSDDITMAGMATGAYVMAPAPTENPDNQEASQSFLELCLNR